MKSPQHYAALSEQAIGEAEKFAYQISGRLLQKAQIYAELSKASAIYYQNRVVEKEKNNVR